jgi:acetyltransferase-like isoleucine patch superfamily enzyme
VDHDARVGPHAQVGPGAHLAGRVTVEAGGYVGIGAAVREGRTIGAWAFVAGGAMVIDDVDPGARVAGVPARPMAPRSA